MYSSSREVPGHTAFADIDFAVRKTVVEPAFAVDNSDLPAADSAVGTADFAAVVVEIAGLAAVETGSGLAV